MKKMIVPPLKKKQHRWDEIDPDSLTAALNWHLIGSEPIEVAESKEVSATPTASLAHGGPGGLFSAPGLGETIANVMQIGAKRSKRKRKEAPDRTPPQAVREAAKRGLELRAKYGRGGLSTQEAGEQGIGSGVARAVSLSKGQAQSWNTIQRMVNFFNRHEKNKGGGESDAGYIAWLLWGGDAGREWAESLLAKREETAKEYDSGVMVCLKVNEPTNELLAGMIPGGLPAQEMHVTLAYLGDLETDAEVLNLEKLRFALSYFAAGRAPLTGKLNGYGRFTGDSDSCPVYINFDSPELPAFRYDLCRVIEKFGQTVKSDHGYTPHITLAYIPKDAPTPTLEVPPLTLRFDEIYLVWGSQWESFPLNEGVIDGKEVRADLQPALEAYKESKQPTGVYVFNDPDGRLRWVTFSSNAYRDRDGEIVSMKALEADVLRAEKEANYGPLRWWHTQAPSIDIGDCDFNMMYGRILIESGTFRNEKIGQAIKEKATDLEVSIGFIHPPTEPDSDGVFHTIRRFERSLLPKGRASNRFTRFLVNQ